MSLKARSVLLSVLLLTACKPDPVPSPTPTPTPTPAPGGQTGVYDGFVKAQGLPTWNEYVATNRLVGTDGDVADPSQPATVEDAGDGSYSCTVEPRSITTTPRDVVLLEPGQGTLWVGGLLQGRGYASVGELQEFPIRKRAPFKVWINLLDRGVSETVDTPDAASVQEAVGKLVATAIERGTKVGGKLSGSKSEVSDVKSALLRMGLSARFGNFKASASMASEKQSQENRVTAHVVENMFTVSMVRPETTDAFFKDLTKADLDAQMSAGNLGKDNLPVYVASVTYGRIVMLTFTSSENMERLQYAASAAYTALTNKVKLDISGEVKRVLNNTKIEVTAFGGDNAAAQQLMLTGDLNQYFLNQPALSQYKPISYTLRDMATDQVVAVSETTKYNLRHCSQKHDEQSLPRTPEFTAYCYTARTNYRGERSGCNSPVITYRAPSRYHLVPNGLGYTKEEIHTGSENDCFIEFKDYADFPDGHFPQTVTLRAHALSPTGRSSGYAEIACRLDGRIVRP